MSKVRLTAIVLAAVAVIATTGCTPTQVAAALCSEQTPVVTKSGTTAQMWRTSTLAAGTVVDASTATFVGSHVANSTTDNPYPVYLEGSAPDVCIVGGHIDFTNDFVTTKWAEWHNMYGLTSFHPDFTTVGLNVDNAGDGVVIGAVPGTPSTEPEQFNIVGARMTRVHDDCIEDDAMRSGLVDDSFLECYSGISARGWTHANGNNHTDGSANTLTVQNSLIHAKSMPESYLDNGAGGHIGWFKFSTAITGQGKPPRLVLKHVTLRVDTAPLPGHTLNLPPVYTDSTHPGVLQQWPMDCEDVTVVWTGTGAYPALDHPYPPCVTVTTDIGVWNDRVAAYDTDHPETL